MSKMRVRVEFTVEVDVDDWAREYGQAADTRQELRDEVRKDVQSYYGNCPSESYPVQAGFARVV